MSWLSQGFEITDEDPALSHWITASRDAVTAAVDTPENRAAWLRHGGTWFAGVNVLNADAEGRIAGGPPLRCAARAQAEAVIGALALDPGQASVTYPGYPRQDPGESDAQHRYRRGRDAAHVDGLLPIGPARRRMIKEPHGYILGLPLDPCRVGEAPLVVWGGSHEVMRRAFSDALAEIPPARWGETDVTDAYQTARRKVFETCPRIEITATTGQAILLHRLTLHGVAPWTADSPADAARTILYFRPILPRGIAEWLTLP